jgi:hypothetical protein
MSKNPGWALLIWAILLCPIVCCGCILWRVLRKKKKPKRGDFHENANPDEYYEDDYEVDDYYDDVYGNDDDYDDGLSSRSHGDGPLVGGDSPDGSDDYENMGSVKPVVVNLAAASSTRGSQHGVRPVSQQISSARPQSQQYVGPPVLQQLSQPQFQQVPIQAVALAYAPPPGLQAAMSSGGPVMVYAPPPNMVQVLQPSQSQWQPRQPLSSSYSQQQAPPPQLPTPITQSTKPSAPPKQQAAHYVESSEESGGGSSHSSGWVEASDSQGDGLSDQESSRASQSSSAQSSSGFEKDD